MPRGLKTVPAYWWDKVPNFGDQLAPLLLKRFAHVDVHWAPPEQARVVTVGSVLEHLPDNYSGYILGTGKLHRDFLPHLCDAKVIGLRGHLSAQSVRGYTPDTVLADPGLLADELVTVGTKLHSTGILPHWTDDTLEHRREFHSHDSVIIRPTRDPLYVVRTIGECKRIVTSSLHGLILADAFGIPRRLIYTPEMDRDGGRFKFEDYSASIGLPLEVGKFQLANRERIWDLKAELFDAFETLGEKLRAE